MSVNTNIQNTLVENGRNTTLLWAPLVVAAGPIPYHYGMVRCSSSEPFYYQLMHIMLKNTELLKHSKITLQHVSVYIETIFRERKSVLG